MRLMILLTSFELLWRDFSDLCQKYQTKFSCIRIKSDKPNSKSLNEKLLLAMD
jgi:hypothetical protein